MTSCTDVQADTESVSELIRDSTRLAELDCTSVKKLPALLTLTLETVQMGLSLKETQLEAQA
jgi:hypothetical protein